MSSGTGARVIRWAPYWTPLSEHSRLARRLRRELPADHELAALRPLLVAKCLSCSDVVGATVHRPPDPELVVVALTRSIPDSDRWPIYERLTLEQFRTRFLEGGEHLIKVS